MRLVRDDDMALEDEPLTDETTERGAEQPDGAVDAVEEELSEADVADLPPVNLPLLEALLFSTHHPLTAGRLGELLEMESTKPVRKAIQDLNKQYEDTGRCFRVEQVAGGYQLLTLPEFGDALKKLHAEHVHAMISVWAKMNPKSENYQAMQKLGFIVPGTDIYDATNPAARDYYWQHLMGVKFAEGWDGFWLDSSEPEIWNGFSDAALDEKQLHIGNGARYTNVFPLMHTGGVYEHWRKTTDQKRVFILTRSAFLGQQRNATTVWSGDVIGSWMSFRRQTPHASSKRSRPSIAARTARSDPSAKRQTCRRRARRLGPAMGLHHGRSSGTPALRAG